MPKKRILFLVLIWLVPLAALCYLINSFSYGSSDLKDGCYTVKNKDLVWELQITNGVPHSVYLQNRRTKEQLLLDGEEFLIKIGDSSDLGWMKTKKGDVFGCRSVKTVIPENCSPIEYSRQKDKTTFQFFYEPFKLELKLVFSYESKGKLIHRSLSIKSNYEKELVLEDVSLGNWTVDGTLSGGGLGLPVFISDKWFFSGVTPWFNATVNKNSLQLQQYPSVYLNCGDSWTSDCVVIGGGDDPKKTLKEYLSTLILPPKFTTLYNTWYDLRDKDLTVQNIFTNFVKLADKLNEFGVKIDYCVIDDGWFDKNSLYGTSTNNFPNGLRELSDDLALRDSKLGLWLPYSGLYLNVTNLIEKYGFENASKKFFCLSGSNYFPALSQRLTDVIEKDKVSFFKHDFNFFVCTMPGHRHLRNFSHSTEVNLKQTARLLDHERKLNPDIYQSVTTGINISPWWLKFAHILWMGGGDIDYDRKNPVTYKPSSEMNYRDGKLYKILVEDETFFPLYALMTHGLIDGIINSVGPWANDEQWADYVMNYLGRGTAIREIFVNHKKLDRKRSEILARGLNWAKEHDELMLNSEMILGDPKKNELYGFKGFDQKGNVYVSLRNPSFLDTSVSLEELGIASAYYKVSYPYHAVYETKLYPKINIPAESVLVVEAAELKDFKEPTFINLRCDYQSSTNSAPTLVVNYDSADPNPIYVYLPDKIKDLSAFKNIKKISGKLWQFDRPEGTDIPRVKITKPFEAQADSFDLEIEVPEGASAKLIWTFNASTAKMTLKDSGKIISPHFTTIPNTGWMTVSANFKSGSHKIAGTIADDNIPVISMDLQMRSSYDLRSMEFNLSGGQPKNNYKSPYPVSQSQFKETTELVKNHQLQIK